MKYVSKPFHTMCILLHMLISLVMMILFWDLNLFLCILSVYYLPLIPHFLCWYKIICTNSKTQFVYNAEKNSINIYVNRKKNFETKEVRLLLKYTDQEMWMLLSDCICKGYIDLLSSREIVIWSMSCNTDVVTQVSLSAVRLL
jgi:hypothetical protein